MSRRGPTNLAASIHQRLLNRAQATGRPFGELLQYFAMERFLYRLSETPHVQRFVLKGALMLNVWSPPTFRATKDIDLLGLASNDIEGLVAAMKDVCVQPVQDDGLFFDAGSVAGRRIAEAAEYEGVRLTLKGSLGNARLSLQVDIGFGDVVTPAAAPIDYPTLLDLPAPHLRGYNRESTVAEKFQAMVVLGSLNSRMKDFYDIWTLSRQFAFTGPLLAEAIRRTFENRHTPIPAHPSAFGASFANDVDKATQWEAFLRKSRLETAPRAFPEVVAAIATFLTPIAVAVADGSAFSSAWPPAGPWR